MIGKRTTFKFNFLFLSALFAGGLLVNRTYSQGINKSNINLLSNLSVPNSTFITDIWGYYDPNTNKEYALITDNFLGLFIVDVTNPSAPSLISQVNNVPGFDVKVWQNYVYTVNGGGSGLGGIVNISNPNTPQIVGSFPSSHNIFIADNGYMYLEYPGLRIYNLNPDPTSPQLVWSKQTGDGHDATVVGNRLYDFHGYAGTFIYDVSTPETPQQLGAITDPSINYHHSGWVSEDGQFLFICDELASHPTADISVWNITNLNNPQRVGQFADGNATVHNFIVKGDFAYASYYTAGFRVFDITTPAQLSIAAEYDTSPHSGEDFAGAFGVYPFGPSGNIYVSDWDNGLFVFSFSDSSSTDIDPPITTVPNNFKLHQNYPNPFNPNTTIKYEIPERAFVTISVYNLLGQEMKTLVSEVKSAGIYSINWDGKDGLENPVPSGVYFCKISAGEFSGVKRMILTR